MGEKMSKREHCQCKSREACRNKRCACLKNDEACGGNCGCVSCGNPLNWGGYRKPDRLRYSKYRAIQGANRQRFSPDVSIAL
jgi:hypothetical protein